MAKVRKMLVILISVVVIGGAAIYAAFELSPWPTVWMVRRDFAKGGQASADAVAPFVPQGISAQRGLSYAPGDRDALFDVYAPKSASSPLPLLVWVHGGGFIGGTRTDMSGYLQVLAGRGFVVVGIDYSLAPEARFPTPVVQTNLALAHLIANAKRFNLDPERIFLAGDSAGAHIVAQAALAISDASYAQRIGVAPGMARASLRGLILHCGIYDPLTLDFRGQFGDFLRVVLWSYVGTRDVNDARVRPLSLTPHVTAAYPPVFISVGNVDGLEPQSVALADALRAQGVQVDALFFPRDHQPPLAHEYHLALATPDAQQALERTIAFLSARAK